MDLFEFSIQMEKDAEALYRKMAENAPVEGIKKVLLMLAEDEVKHRVAIEQLQKKLDVPAQQGVALDIKTVFDDLKNDAGITSISTDAVPVSTCAMNPISVKAGNGPNGNTKDPSGGAALRPAKYLMARIAE